MELEDCVDEIEKLKIQKNGFDIEKIKENLEKEKLECEKAEKIYNLKNIVDNYHAIKKYCQNT